jgi:hypothetical protein
MVMVIRSYELFTMVLSPPDKNARLSHDSEAEQIPANNRREIRRLRLICW